MSKMEEEGSSKWTEEQLAETMMDLSGINSRYSTTDPPQGK